MESHLCSHDVITVRTIFFNTVFTCHLDHGFIGFGTGILVEDLIHPDSLTNLLCEKSLRDRVRIIECMHQGFRLLYCCGYNLLVAASCRVNGDARIEIKICFTVLVVDVLILSSLCEKIESLVCLDHIFLDLVLDVLCRKSCVCKFHNISPLLFLFVFGLLTDLIFSYVSFKDQELFDDLYAILDTDLLAV